MCRDRLHSQQLLFATWPSALVHLPWSTVLVLECASPDATHTACMLWGAAGNLQRCWCLVQVRAAMNNEGGDMPAVPITVRQLEAVVRISEALARMQLQVNVTQSHVAAALDLFKASTMDAVRSGATDNLVSTLTSLTGCMSKATPVLGTVCALMSPCLRSDGTALQAAHGCTACCMEVVRDILVLRSTLHDALSQSTYC